LDTFGFAIHGHTMATFYLLPPRPILGDHLLDSLERFLPGLDWTISARRHLMEVFLDSLDLADDIFLVFREDLPHGVPAEVALVDGYGAEPGDEVIEVRSGLPTRRWHIGQVNYQLN
jgi:hypothetical protein